MIRIGIYGYGNLGRGVEYALKQNKDMEAVAVFTRRDPKTVKTAVAAGVAAKVRLLLKFACPAAPLCAMPKTAD